MQFSADQNVPCYNRSVMTGATIYSSVVASWQEIPAAIADASLIGGKAAGLLKIPLLWTPKFISLTSRFYQKWSTGGTAAALQQLTSCEITLLNELLVFAQTNNAQILVRSNSPLETGLRYRGRFKSFAAKPVMSEVAEAINSVLGQSQDTAVFSLLQLSI
jgi:hypothetical protein